MTGFLADVRFGARLLVKSPVFTASALLLLAAGISANTLIFSLVNALLLRPLPVSHPENLVRVVEVHPNDFVTWDFPYGFCNAVAERNPDFSEVICQGAADVAFSAGSLTERVRVHLVSPNFFSSLGVRALLGRVLTAADENGGARYAVVSYGFWQHKLLGEAAALGRRITLGGHPFTIVGVTPEGFNGLSTDTSPDIRVAAAVDRYLVKPEGEMNPAARPLFGEIFARLRRGVSLRQANAHADSLLKAAYQEETEKVFPPAKGATAAKGPMDSHLLLESVLYGVSALRAQFSRGLEVLMAAVALLLLMVCANVAGLLLARSAARAPEMSIRLALGASTGRIVRQLFTEGLLLSLLGGISGLLLTLACLPLLAGILPPIRDRGAVLLPLAVDIHLDYRVLAFALGITVLTAVLFAMSPALHGAKTGALRSDRTVTRRMPARSLMVTAQVALCTLILMGAALLVGTLERLRGVDPGFDRDHVLTITIDPGMGRGVSRRSLLEKARALPGVESASLASRAVMRGTGLKSTFGAAGTRIAPSDFLNSSLNSITPGYFETMGMHLVAGRAFNGFDEKPSTPRRVIVNQAFARRFLARKDPLGQRFGLPGAGGIATGDNEIIGVVSDAKYRSLREAVPPTVYSPMADDYASQFTLQIRTRLPLGAVQQALDPGLPVIEARTLRDEIEASLWQEYLLALLSTIFGAIAVLLASIGLYGALDYAVKSRTREIGVRMALGAQASRIVGLFSRDVLLFTAGGLALGLCGYAAATIWIRGVLYDLRPWEPTVVLSVVLVIASVAAAASAPAVYRALRTDPASALRGE